MSGEKSRYADPAILRVDALARRSAGSWLTSDRSTWSRRHARAGVHEVAQGLVRSLVVANPCCGIGRGRQVRVQGASAPVRCPRCDGVPVRLTRLAGPVARRPRLPSTPAFRRRQRRLARVEQRPSRGRPPRTAPEAQRRSRDQAAAPTTPAAAGDPDQRPAVPSSARLPGRRGSGSGPRCAPTTAQRGRASAQTVAALRRPGVASVRRRERNQRQVPQVDPVGALPDPSQRRHPESLPEQGRRGRHRHQKRGRNASSRRPPRYSDIEYSSRDHRAPPPASAATPAPSSEIRPLADRHPRDPGRQTSATAAPMSSSPARVSVPS